MRVTLYSNCWRNAMNNIKRLQALKRQAKNIINELYNIKVENPSSLLIYKSVLYALTKQIDMEIRLWQEKEHQDKN